MGEEKYDAPAKREFSAEDQEMIDQVSKLPLSDEDKDIIMATLEMYSGPIPHPKILAGYQALYPDAAQKIIENGLEESRHRRELESARQKRRGRLAWATLVFLTIAVLLFIVLSFFLIMNGHEIIGGVFAGVSMLAFFGSLSEQVNQLTNNTDRESQKEDKP